MKESEVHAKLLAIFPDFAAYWDSPCNYHRGDDGSYSLCGVFSRLSDYVREQLDVLRPSSLDELGRFIEECLELPLTSDLRNAAAACFLENLAGEKFTPIVAAHLGSRAREFLSQYGSAA